MPVKRISKRRIVGEKLRIARLLEVSAVDAVAGKDDGFGIHLVSQAGARLPSIGVDIHQRRPA